MSKGPQGMKIALPPEMYGGNPAGLIEYLGLTMERRPTNPADVWEVSLGPTDLVECTTLHSPALKHSRFDISTAPTPEVPGGIPRELASEFQRFVEKPDGIPTLQGALARIAQTLVAVPDLQVPDTIKWASTTLDQMPLENADGSTEPLFPHHSIHDVRINPLTYRWTKLPQIFLRLRHTPLPDVIAGQQASAPDMAFQSSAALLEGTVFGGLYYIPLLASLSPMMWGFGATRVGQVIVLTFGRTTGGRSQAADRDALDVLQQLTHYQSSHQFDTALFNESTLHKAAWSETVEWWTSRINQTLLDLFAPTTYVDDAGVYRPDIHQRWMLNLEQLLARIGMILRYPRDEAMQLALLFPAMDLLADSFTGSNGIGQLMSPKRISKRIKAIEKHVPDRAKPVVLAPALRALTAAEQVAGEFFMTSPDPNATEETRLIQLWNARRNATHGFNKNAEILAEHSGRLPADIVLVPMVYLLDILTDRENLIKRITHGCNGK